MDFTPRRVRPPPPRTPKKITMAGGETVVGKPKPVKGRPRPKTKLPEVLRNKESEPSVGELKKRLHLANMKQSETEELLENALALITKLTLQVTANQKELAFYQQQGRNGMLCNEAQQARFSEPDSPSIMSQSSDRQIPERLLKLPEDGSIGLSERSDSAGCLPTSPLLTNSFYDMIRDVPAMPDSDGEEGLFDRRQISSNVTEDSESSDRGGMPPTAEQRNDDSPPSKKSPQTDYTDELSYLEHRAEPLDLAEWSKGAPVKGSLFFR